MANTPMREGIGYTDQTFFLDIPSGAKRLILTFAINKSRTVTFTTRLPGQ